MNRWQPHCCECGRFVSYTAADCGTMYGNSTRLEPPAADFFCKSCAAENIAKAVARGSTIDCWWIKPAWVRIAKSILRHRHKHRGIGSV